MWVRSELHTVQDEGPFAGQTAYSVQLASKNEGDHASARDLYLRYEQSKARVMVVRGEEPLLQAPALSELAHICHARGKIQVETLGTHYKSLERVWEANHDTHFLITLKAHEATGYPNVVLRNVAKLSMSPIHAYLRIVIGSQPPYDALPPLDKIGLRFLREFVYLSPMIEYDNELVDHAQTAANYRRAVELCLENNFKLTTKSPYASAII